MNCRPVTLGAFVNCLALGGTGLSCITSGATKIGAELRIFLVRRYLFRGIGSGKPSTSDV